MSGDGGGEAGHVSGEFRGYAEQLSASLSDLAREVEALGARVAALAERVDATDRQLVVMTRLWVEAATAGGRLAERVKRVERRLETRSGELAGELLDLIGRVDALDAKVEGIGDSLVAHQEREGRHP